MIGGNKLENEGANYIVEALKTNRTLHALDISTMLV